MFTIFVLFVGLILATAVIAYWSDNLGKKLGKKRVSLWGMRPRTTATFLTIASSWLIMVFTLVVLLTVFSPLRQALLRFDEVKAQEGILRKSKAKLETRVGTLDARLRELQSQKAQLTSKVEGASQQLKSVQDKLSAARTEIQSARDKRDAAQDQARKAQAGASQARARAAQASASERAARANLSKVSAQRDATQQQRDAAQNQLRATQTQLNNAQTQVRQADAKVSAANARVARANAQYQAASARLSQAEQDLRVAQQDERRAQSNARNAAARAADAEKRASDIGTKVIDVSRTLLQTEKKVIQAEAKVDAAQTQVDQLETQAQRLREANAALVADNKRIVEQANEIFLSDVRVPVDRTLVARTFEQTPSFSDARDELRALFDRAADKIVPGLLPGARLQLLPLYIGDQQNPLQLTQNEIFNQLATVISHNQNALSVRLIAARNHREGDKFLDARFVVVPVRPALSTGAELASTVLDGRASDARLFSALLNLVDEGRDFAASKGVSPPLSPEAPDFYAPGSREQLFQTLRAISAINGTARVRILTLQPISTVDQLSVRFEIEPVASSATPAEAVASAPTS